MKINKAYKFRLYPNTQQEQLLCQHAGNTRFVWNYFNRKINAVDSFKFRNFLKFKENIHAWYFLKFE